MPRFKDFFIFCFMLVSCIFMYHVCVSAHRGKEEGPDLLHLGIPAIVCYPMDGGTQTRIFSRSNKCSLLLTRFFSPYILSSNHYT